MKNWPRSAHTREIVDWAITVCDKNKKKIHAHPILFISLPRFASSFYSLYLKRTAADRTSYDASRRLPALSHFFSTWPKTAKRNDNGSRTQSKNDRVKKA